MLQAVTRGASSAQNVRFLVVPRIQGTCSGETFGGWRGLSPDKELVCGTEKSRFYASGVGMLLFVLTVLP